MFQHTQQTFGDVYRSGFCGLITLKKFARNNRSLACQNS